MPIAPLPATLEYLSGRKFAFYPPIRNIGRNEWLYRRATWSECIVANLGNGDEFSIPLMFVGEASIVDEPADGEPSTVVELHGELEWRLGAILPCQKRVVELPVAVESDESDDERPRSGRLAPVISIRLEPKPEAGAGRWLGVALVLGVVACTIAADIAVQSHRRSESGAVSQAWLELTPDDDYRAVLNKLGPPAKERSFERSGESFRVLTYPALRFSVVLRGRNVPDARYTETVDRGGRVLGGERAPLRAF